MNGRRRPWGIVAAVAALAVQAAFLATSAAAAQMPFGSDLARAPNSGTTTCLGAGSPCTNFGISFPAANTIPASSPINGVVVSFRISSQTADTVTFRLIGPGVGLGNWIGDGTGPTVNLVGTSSPESFPARIPVKVGDFAA